jgi:hypothetical protein
VAKTVFYELVMACLFAAAPTSLSPSLVKATTDGVVLAPLSIFNNFRSAPFHNCNTRVCGSQIDTNDSSCFFGRKSSHYGISECSSHHCLILMLIMKRREFLSGNTSSDSISY